MLGFGHFIRRGLYTRRTVAGRSGMAKVMGSYFGRVAGGCKSRPEVMCRVGKRGLAHGKFEPHAEVENCSKSPS